MDRDLIYDIALSYDDSITSIEKVLLYKKMGSSHKIFSLSKNTLRNLLGRGWTGKRFNPEKLVRKAKEVSLYLEKAQVKMVRFFDPDFPVGLSAIPDHPFMIYVKGNLDYPFERSAAIVGTRNPDQTGLMRTQLFTEGLVAYQYCIISGLAHGVDTASHYHCIKNGGKTIAVLGSGIDRIYPYANKKLAQDILLHNGAIISEYPPGVFPNRWNFPRRNRIIVGLSQCVCIIQAPSRSGSLISANLALDYNRDLYVASPSMHSGKMDEGNEELIFSGASAIQSIQQLLDDQLYTAY